MVQEKPAVDYTKNVFVIILLIGTAQVVFVRVNINTLAPTQTKARPALPAVVNMQVVLALADMNGMVHPALNSANIKEP